MATKESPGQFDALEKAAPNEPVFPLLARDECAPATITFWCHQRRNRAFKLYGESSKDADRELLAAELRQAANAEEVALQFDDYRKQEAPADIVRSSYNEVIKSAEELAEADRRKRREQAVADLSEASYHLCEARDLLISLDALSDDTEVMAVGVLEWLKALADAHRIKRPQFAEPTLPLEIPA